MPKDCYNVIKLKENKRIYVNVYRRKKIMDPTFVYFEDNRAIDSR